MKKLFTFILYFCLMGIFFAANAGLNPELEQLILHYKDTDQRLNASNDVHVFDPWVKKHGARLVNEIKKQEPYDQYWPGLDPGIFQTIKDMCAQYATNSIPILKHDDGGIYNLSTEEALNKFTNAIDHLESLRAARDMEGNVTDIFGNCNTTDLLTASLAIILSSGNIHEQVKIIEKFVKRILDAEGTCLQGQTNRLVAFLIIDTLQYKVSSSIAAAKERLIQKYRYNREQNPAHAFYPQIITTLQSDSELRNVLSVDEIQQIINNFKLSEEGQKWANEIGATQAIYGGSQVSNAGIKQAQLYQAPQPTVTPEDAKVQLRKIYESRMSQNAEMIARGHISIDRVKEDVKKSLVNQYVKGKRITTVLYEQECYVFIDSLGQAPASDMESLEQKLAALKLL